MDMLKDWDNSHTSKFQKETFTFRHNLNQSGLFTDEALIKLMSKHPSHMTDVCSMGDKDHPEYPNKFRTGDFRDTEPAALLAAAKAGRVWINLRKAMNLHPEYKTLLDRMYGELADVTKTTAYNANGGILISSPISQTPYHFDKTETILWHVRGAKRIYIYPLTQDFISDQNFESVITQNLEDDLPYNAEFDKHAIVIDLEEDQAATWPLNSPHRVDNSAFCVSVTTEYSTKESSFKNAGMIANATLRKKFGMNPSWTEDPQPARLAKFVMGKILKATNSEVKTPMTDLVTFKIDPNTPGFVVDTEPFPRNF